MRTFDKEYKEYLYTCYGKLALNDTYLNITSIRTRMNSPFQRFIYLKLKSEFPDVPTLILIKVKIIASKTYDIENNKFDPCVYETIINYLI